MVFSKPPFVEYLPFLVRIPVYDFQDITIFLRLLMRFMLWRFLGKIKMYQSNRYLKSMSYLFGFRYSKDETFKLTTSNENQRRFSLVIAEMPTCRKRFKHYKKQHTVSGFSRLIFSKNFPFVKVHFEDKLCILASLDVQLLNLHWLAY